MAKSSSDDPWEYNLRKYLLLLVTLVATVTYAAGFNPPGGVWQDTNPVAGYLAGDPIIRDTSHFRCLAFFYCNATAFASSLVVIVLILILSVLHDRGSTKHMAPVRCLRVVMTLDLLSLMGAYAAGTCRDSVTPVYSSVLVLGVVGYLAVHMVLATRSGRKVDSPLERLRKVLMLLATFAVSVTYIAGLSAPGGFWSNADHGHRPGHAVLKGGPHDARLKAFFVCNTTAFVASLLIIVLLLDKELRKSNKMRSFELYGFIFVALVGLVGAYSAGSCRDTYTTIYVNCRDGHEAGNPIMYDNRRPRYKAFFYSNSTSFVASIIVIILLLPESLHKEKWYLGVMNTTIVLDLLGLLVAYAAGSSRSWRASGYVTALVIAVLAYFTIHVVLSCIYRRRKKARSNYARQLKERGDSGYQRQIAPE